MSYRPEGMKKNPYPEQEHTKPEFECKLAFEAGADAYEEGLKREA